jgi:uncharacterized protein
MPHPLKADRRAHTRPHTRAPQRLLLLLPMLLACADATREDTASTDSEIAASTRAPQGIVDHHVHLLGPDIMRDWRSLGVTFSRPDSVYTSATAWLATQGVGVNRVVFVPMSHLYGSSELIEALDLDTDAQQARVRRENDHVAREAARLGDRAVALCSAPVLAPWALDEYARCHAELRTAGLKLHLAASGVDLRDDTHLRQLDRIAAWAEQFGLPMLLHLDTQRRGTDVADIRRFAEVVLAPHPALHVIVAHAGGSGGYGRWTRSVLGTLLTWLREVESREGARRPITIDLSAVILEEESEGVPPSTTAERDALRADVRAAGLDRFVFGSDAPVFEPARSAQVLREVLGLTGDEAEAWWGGSAIAAWATVAGPPA